MKYNYIETADISKDNPKLVLYQLGILTIKDVIGEAYRLGFPNREVNRTALGGFVTLGARRISNLPGRLAGDFDIR